MMQLTAKLFDQAMFASLKAFKYNSVS